MADELVVRRYRPGDGERIRELHETTMREEGALVDEDSELFELLPDHVELDADLHDVSGAYFEAGGEFLVGERDDEIVATGAFRPTDDATVEVERMRVAPDFQQQGYGQRILDALETEAVERGFTGFVLDTLARLRGARNFYEKNGYRETERKTAGEYELCFYRKSVADD